MFTGDSGESEGEIDASKTRSGKGYQNDDNDDDDPYIPQPLSKTPAPPWHRRERHPSKVIDVEEADDAPKEGIQLERWGELPEIQESEGDNQSIDSLEISEPDIDVPKAPTPQPAPSPAPAASRPTRERHPPDFLSPKMSGQYHGGEMTFMCDIYLVEIADNVSAFFDDMAFLLTLADKNTMTLKDALNEPDAEEFVKAMIKEVNDHVSREHWIIVSVKDMIRNGYKKNLSWASGP